MRKFTYDMFDQIAPPTLILSTKYHKHLGNLVNVQNISCEFNMSSHQEISFDVYKEYNGTKCKLWNKIVDFKYLYVPEHNEYYELQVDIDETNATVKHVVGVSASERELSQKYLRDFHVNDETDILRDDYVVTVLYNPNNPNGSLLDRVLHDKGQSWSIGHVDETIARIQRTFTADNTTIYDFLMNTVAKEIECLFLYDSVNRTISAYDLKCNCNNPHCEYRGEFTDACPKCGSTDITKGYGKYQNVFVASENFATQLTVDGDADSVKNCFKVSGGDDLMTATVANINPNKSNYIYKFSQLMLDDMPTSLKNKLIAYNSLYQSKVDEYTDLTEDYYEALDNEAYYQTTMMPETPMPEDTTAQEQLDILMAASFTVAVQNITSISKASADLAVKGYAKVLVDPRYTVDVLQSSLSDLQPNDTRTWTGKFKVTSLGKVDDEGNPDEATSDTTRNVTINGNYEEFLQEKIQKSLDRKDASFITIFKIEDDATFRHELTEYSLDRLTSFSSSYQAVLEVLVQQGVADTQGLNPLNPDDLYKIELYNTVYRPYYRRKGWIDAEAVVREGEVKVAHAEVERINKLRLRIQNQLNLPKYLGADYDTFTLYLREDTYNNSNYISDGLDNAELVAKAQELFNVAEAEVLKASELQYSLSGTLQNFLNTHEFRSVKGKFEIGDWIICKVDDEIYRLRLINIGYSYDNPTDMSVTFSNAIRVNDTVSDVSDILNKAQSMATSYDTTAHQASEGKKAKNTVNGFLKTGLDSALYNVLSGQNQEIIIDEHGLTAKAIDDATGQYSPEQLKVTNNILAFTNDNWEHAVLGLGKHDYKHYNGSTNSWVTDTDYGLSAKFVQAGWIYGSEIAAGQVYSSNYDSANSVGTHIDLDNGTFSFAGDGLTYDGTDLMLGGFKVITDGIVTNNITIMADGEIISDYMVGQVDKTPTAENHGEIFNTYADGRLPWAKHDAIQMDQITKFTYGSTDTIAVSAEETKITWTDTIPDPEPGVRYYANVFYYPVKDVTNLNYLAYDVITGARNVGGEDLVIGLTSTAPTSWQDYIVWDAYVTITGAYNEFRGGIDISSLSGNKYVVVKAYDGWNATLKKLDLVEDIGLINKATGVQSRASGNNTTASGRCSSASGESTQAIGDYSTTEGYQTLVSTPMGHAEGQGSRVVSGYGGHAEGSSMVTDSYGHSEGLNTQAQYCCHAEGYGTKAVNQYTHCEGFGGTVSGEYSHGEGWNINCSGQMSHVEGSSCVNIGRASHVEGYSCKIENSFAVGAHVEGNYGLLGGSNNAEGTHVEGYLTEAYSGLGAHVEGRRCKVYSDSAHVEGYSCVAGSSIGEVSEASYSHAEGSETKTLASAAHSEGYDTVASGYASHASGAHTVASGQNSYTGGYYTTASGVNSCANGSYTIANHDDQFVFGAYNIADNSSATDHGNYVEIVGNGTADNARSNARTLDWNGNEVLAGKLTVGADPVNDMDVVTKRYIDDITGVVDFTGATASTAGTHGLVIAPQAGDQDKFLKGDGTWTTIAGAIDFTGATSSTDGTHGLVIAPSAGDQDKFLKGNGTWTAIPVMTGSTTTTTGASGLVPQPYIADKDKYLKGDGTWASIDMPSVFTGATASTAGTVGTVPAPSSGYQTRFLSGDGNWERVTQLDNYYTTRPTTANVSLTGGLNYFLATSSMTEGKPPADSHIIHTSWDNNNTELGVQLALAHGTNPRMWIRSQSSGTWTGWYMVALQNTTAALTTDRAVVTSTNGKLNVSSVTTTELGYLSGVTSAVQTQIDGKSTVSFSRTLSSGTKIGEITIDGTTQNIYAPSGGGGGGSVDDVQVNGVSVVTSGIAEIDLTGYETTSDLTTNYYTKTQTDNLLSAKADSSSVYSKTDIDTALSGKQATITGAATTITSSNLTASRVLISNSNGKVAVSSVTSTELGYLSGVTGAIQTQINGKSTVSLSPTISTGTKIAEVTINGVTQNLYAPNGGGGSSVIPNPQGTPTDILSSVSIDDVIYSVSGNSGAITGTTAPTAQQGSNGSLYVQYDATDNSIKYVYCKINDVWSLFPFEYSDDAFVDGEGSSMTTSDGDNLIFVD